jgi:hypothetical protein
MTAFITFSFVATYGFALLMHVTESSRVFEEIQFSRLLAMASRDPCPRISEHGKYCRWTIQVKAHDDWQSCQDGRLPSGDQDLPARRWIRMIPKCQSSMGITYQVASMEVFRR